MFTISTDMSRDKGERLWNMEWHGESRSMLAILIWPSFFWHCQQQILQRSEFVVLHKEDWAVWDGILSWALNDLKYFLPSHFFESWVLGWARMFPNENSRINFCEEKLTNKLGHRMLSSAIPENNHICILLEGKKKHYFCSLLLILCFNNARWFSSSFFFSLQTRDIIRV